jgi:hypothetical protein
MWAPDWRCWRHADHPARHRAPSRRRGHAQPARPKRALSRELHSHWYSVLPSPSPRVFRCLPVTRGGRLPPERGRQKGSCTAVLSWRTPGTGGPRTRGRTLSSRPHNARSRREIGRRMHEAWLQHSARHPPGTGHGATGAEPHTPSAGGWAPSAESSVPGPPPAPARPRPLAGDRREDGRTSATGARPGGPRRRFLHALRLAQLAVPRTRRPVPGGRAHQRGHPGPGQHPAGRPGPSAGAQR